MFFNKIDDRTILEISQGDDFRATADSFLIDRQARELSRHTLKFYREFLRTFIEYCNANSLIFIQQISCQEILQCNLMIPVDHDTGTGAFLRQPGPAGSAPWAAYDIYKL